MDNHYNRIVRCDMSNSLFSKEQSEKSAMDIYNITLDSLHDPVNEMISKTKLYTDIAFLHSLIPEFNEFFQKFNCGDISNKDDALSSLLASQNIQKILSFEIAHRIVRQNFVIGYKIKAQNSLYFLEYKLIGSYEWQLDH